MANSLYVFEAKAQIHTHTIILLHGRDSNASEFARELFESQASDDRTFPDILPSVKWVFPSSQPRLSARFGDELCQWFDIWSVEEPSLKEELQLEGLRESVKEILAVVKEEMKMVPASRIVLGGISQGCATAIHALLVGKVRLCGFIGFCSWLPLKNRIDHLSRTVSRREFPDHINTVFGVGLSGHHALQSVDEDTASAIDTPIFLAHSKDDDVVPIKNGKDLLDSLRALDCKVTWIGYEIGGHWINEPEGVDDVVHFLTSTCGMRNSAVI